MGLIREHLVRLLILTPEFASTGGGITTFYRSLAAAYRSLGICVSVIEGSSVHAAERAIPAELDGVHVEVLDRARLDDWHGKFEHFSAMPTLRRYLAAAWAMWEQADYGRDFDVVEACDWGLLFLPPAIEASRPLIVQCHGSAGQISVYDPVEGEESCSITTRLLERSCMAVAQQVQTYSRANAAFWREETSREIDTIPPVWSRKQQSDFPSPSGRGLVIGRVQRWKGPQVVCEALKRLGDRAPVIDWVGRDTVWGVRKSSSAARLCADYPEIWGRKIIQHPQIKPAEVAIRQQAALFNVIPSTWDVFNFTVVEAMSSGRPTIVSTGAGASELIEDGVNGFLFPAGDAGTLATVLDRVLSESPERLAEIGRAAQETVRYALDPQRIAQQRVAAYQVAIDDFAQRASVPVGGWLGAICQPAPSSADQMAFLDGFPLRNLARHVAHRTIRRILK
jgi:glycosyltransferase involved in cell wall biosynthesis